MSTPAADAKGREHPRFLETRLLIATTWDGVEIPRSENVSVGVRVGRWSIRVEIDAPYHADPPPPDPRPKTPAIEDLAAGEPSRDYTEIELSPHGHFLILRFAGLRRRTAIVRPREVRTEIRGHRWSGWMAVDRRDLPPRPWRANAFSIHGREQARRYLAAAPLPGEHPDFHQPVRFPFLFP